MSARPNSAADTPQFVEEADLASLLATLRALPGLERDGFFGPASLSWTINRESAVFLGAGRAALLQLAHPWVTAALQQHSSLMSDAIGRFHSTFRVIYTMLFGTRAQALTASRRLYALHTTVRGTLPQTVGAHTARTPYQANEVAALRWVYATLVESAVLAYEFVLPALEEDALETFYGESRRVAALCGVPPQTLPATWRELRAFVAEMMASEVLGVDATARSMGQVVLAGAGTWVKSPRWYRALTASWLPERLRSGFGLPLGEADERSLRRAAVWLPRIYLRLPAAVRFVGPYHEAYARLHGRAPGAMTQRNNRFWMGVPRLLHGEQENG